MSCAIRLLPARGEVVAGDVGIYLEAGGYALAGVADVLGHGPRANQVAQRVHRFLHARFDADLLVTLRGLDEHLRGTIGAAVALCGIDLATGAGSHIALGNVTTRWLPGGREFVSRDGCVGAPGTPSRLREGVTTSFQLQDDDLLMMFSDGIRSGVRRATEPGIASSDAGVVAETVVSNYARGHDDAICLAMRYRT